MMWKCLGAGNISLGMLGGEWEREERGRRRRAKERGKILDVIYFLFLSPFLPLSHPSPSSFSLSFS
jgi:hypothetical protein